MLLTIYEEENSAKFSSKFITPLTLPKNAEIKLLKAYIPRDHDITIDATNDQLTINLHSEEATAKTVLTLAHASYGVNDLAKHIQDLINATSLSVENTGIGQLHKLTCKITATIENNQLATNTFSIYLRPQSLQGDFYYELNFDSVGNEITSDLQEEKAVATDVYTIVKGNQTLRCSVYTDNTPADKKGWDNDTILNRALDRQRFSIQHHPDYDNSRPAFNQIHTLVSFTCGDLLGSSSSILVGLTEHGTAIDKSTVAINDLSSCDQLKGISCAVVIYGETANGKGAGDTEFFEDIGGTFTSKGILEGDNIGLGDEIIIVVPLNNRGGADAPCDYYIKFLNGDITKITVAQPANRYKPADSAVLNTVFSFYNGSDVVDTITDLKMGMDAGYMPEALDTTKGVGLFDDFGKYIKLSLGGATNDNKILNTTLGFNTETYEEESATANRADAIDIKNDVEMLTNDGKQPFLNVNITNLPITSFSCCSSQSTGGGDTPQHDYSKCVASIPRYNQDNGHYDNLAIVFDNNTQSIKLHNVDEIILSSLDFRLQNCDGTYPKDLLTPSSYVFKISGE